MCEQEYNVGEKHILPQDQALGLSWSTPMDQSYPLRCHEEGPRGATGQRAPADPTDKQTPDMDQVMALALEVEIMSPPSLHECLRAKQSTCLSEYRTKEVQAS